MARLNDLARECAGFLKRGEREADGIGKILLTESGAPQWFTDLCRAAHDEARILPDDWRYEFIGDALDCIAGEDADDDDELREKFREWFDGAYIYTAQQTAWLASSLERPGYVDEALEECGADGLDTMQRIALGMLREAEEVFASVLSTLQERADEAEAEEEAAAE